MRRFLPLLAAGFVLCLTTGCPPAPPQPRPTYVRPPVALPPGGARYTVRAGDTLYSIARAHGVDLAALLLANPTVNARELAPGTVIAIPGGGVTATVAPVKPSEPVPNPGHPGPIPAEGQFVWPIKGDILARFGQAVSWRMNERSYGLDIRAAAGQIVVAAKSGKVNTFSLIPGLGRVVILEHSDGYSTLYGHLDRILVTHGTWVRQGETVGTAGSTGRSSGTELNFRVWKGSQFVDPMPLLPR